MVHLIVGYGEVGKALHEVLDEALYVDPILGCTWDGSFVDVVHISIPYSDKFNEIVEDYKTFGNLVIVHSSVPVETCDSLGVVHSPIRGVHPYLAEGIRTFVKYFGGERATEAALIFAKLGLNVKIFDKARTTEALKLWDTTQYGRLIMMEKEIHQWCLDHNIDFDSIYTEANRDYNEGYTKLGMQHVVRPYLKHMEGPIGGHCVMPNTKLLGVEL